MGKLFRGPDQYKISICRPVQKLVKYSSVIYFSYKLESYVSIVVKCSITCKMKVFFSKIKIEKNAFIALKIKHLYEK